MQVYQMEGEEKLLREMAQRAIDLAAQGRWAEAVEVNRAILSRSPEDLEALNRLGKALMELGHLEEARQAFEQALRLSPTNPIARKNLDRLAHLKRAGTPTGKRPAPHLFLGEKGKTCVTALRHLAPPEVLAKASPGDEVNLKVEGNRLLVEDSSGTYLGQVEPRLASRLRKLMAGGNRYVAAVASVEEKALSIIIREVFRHPSLAGTVSFPTRAEEMAPGWELSEEERLPEWGPLAPEEEEGLLAEETPSEAPEPTEEVE